MGIQRAGKRSPDDFKLMLQKYSMEAWIRWVVRLTVSVCLFAVACGMAGAAKDQLHSPGFSGELSAPEVDVLHVLNDVLEDQTIHGTHMFDKELTLTGAQMVTSTPLFEPWNGPGKVFYKIRKDAIAPRHFLESGDQGTIAVRYVVTSVSPERTRIRIDAVYVENTHRRAHPSDGTVESSEFKVIQDHLQAMQFAAQEAADAKRRRESAELVQQAYVLQHEDETARLVKAQSSVQELERQINSLRHEVERRVKAPGAELKAAPVRSAATMKTLAAYSEVLIVIVTPYWFGVETPDGQRGWLPASQLEILP
jgi:hypothetical protein